MQVHPESARPDAVTDLLQHTGEANIPQPSSVTGKAQNGGYFSKLW